MEIINGKLKIMHAFKYVVLTMSFQAGELVIQYSAIFQYKDNIIVDISTREGRSKDLTLLKFLKQIASHFYSHLPMQCSCQTELVIRDAQT